MAVGPAPDIAAPASPGPANACGCNPRAVLAPRPQAKKSRKGKCCPMSKSQNDVAPAGRIVAQPPVRPKPSQRFVKSGDGETFETWQTDGICGDRRRGASPAAYLRSWRCPQLNQSRQRREAVMPLTKHLARSSAARSATSSTGGQFPRAPQGIARLKSPVSYIRERARSK